MLDEIDLKILSIIQKNARASNSDIAEQVGMANSAVFERIKKLEKRAVIQGYEARVNPQALNLGLVAFVAVKSDERLDSRMQTGYKIAQIPGVLEVHDVAGDDCYLVKVRVANTEELGHLLREHFGAIPTVQSTRTTIVLTTIKETGQLPLPISESEAK